MKSNARNQRQTAYQILVAIAADPAQPGFKHILMKPHPVGDLTHVKATHRSPYGLIKSE